VHPYEHLSREERIRRIGEILAKGVTLLAIKQQEDARKAGVAQVVVQVEQSETDWITRGIVEFLKRVGWASPREIRLHVDVTQRTCARHLQAMLVGGMLESRGLTSAVQYRIRTMPG
jgi:hypothetical protein